MVRGADKAWLAGYWRSFVDRLWAAADIEASPVRRAAVRGGRVLYIAIEGFVDKLPWIPIWVDELPPLHDTIAAPLRDVALIVTPHTGELEEWCDWRREIARVICRASQLMLDDWKHVADKTYPQRYVNGAALAGYVVRATADVFETRDGAGKFVEIARSYAGFAAMTGPPPAPLGPPPTTPPPSRLAADRNDWRSSEASYRWGASRGRCSARS